MEEKTIEITFVADVWDFENTVEVQPDLEFDLKITEEEYQRILKSIESNKYQTMDEDKDLKDICNRCFEMVDEFDVSSFDCDDKTFGDYPYGFNYVFRYPTAILKNTNSPLRRSGFDCPAYGYRIPDDAKVIVGEDGLRRIVYPEE